MIPKFFGWMFAMRERKRGEMTKNGKEADRNTTRQCEQNL